MIPALLLAALALPAAADEAHTCPLVLPRTTVEVKPPVGWTGYSPSIVRLTGYGMMAGPPDSMTYLVPSGSKKLKDGSISTWLFSKGEERWVYCTYDDSGAIQISRRLADDATECTLSYNRDKFGSIGEMTVACK